MRALLLIPALAIAGCAITPQQMAQQSNWDVCRFTMGGPHSGVAQNEAGRRGLDCAPLYPAIAAKQQADAQALANFQRALNPPRPAYRPPMNCNSYRLGNTIQTDCR